MIRQSIMLVICCLCASLQLPAQFYFYNDDYFDSPLIIELGASVGGMNCLTDLGGRNRKGRGFILDMNGRATHACGTLFTSFQYNNTLGLKFELTLGKVSGADSLISGNNPGGQGRYQRNLDFQSQIREAVLVVEWYPLSLPALSINGPPAMNPYLFAGAGLFSFRPETKYQHQQQDLFLLHTEGQGFAEYPGRKLYSLRQWNLPAGVGLKFEPSAIAVIRLEFTYRKLWTDYLDDVSSTYIDPELFFKNLSAGNADRARKLADRTRKPVAGTSMLPGSIRGNDKNNDAYFSLNLKLAVALGRTKR